MSDLRLPKAPGALPDVHRTALFALCGACALSLGVVVWLAAKVHPAWSTLALLPVISLWRQLAQSVADAKGIWLLPEKSAGQSQITGGFVFADMAYVKSREGRGWHSVLVTKGAVGEGACRRLRIFLRHRSEA